MLLHPIETVRSPMGAGEALDWSLRLYRRAFLPILTLSALFVAPYTVASLYLNTAKAGDLVLSPLLRAAGQPVPGLTPEDLLGQTYLLVLGGLLLGPLLYAALIRVADQLWRGETPTVGGALRWALRRLVAMLVTGLIVLVAGSLFTLVSGLFGSMTVGIGMGVFLAGMTEANEIVQGLVGLLFILVVFFLVQFAWVGFLLVPQSVVIDGRGYFGALGRSLTLVYTYLFRSMAIFWAVLAFIGSLSLIWLLPSMLWEMAVGETGLHLVESLAAGVIWLLTFPLLPLATTVIYYDFRLRSEAHDLAAQLSCLEKGGGAGA